MPANTSILIKRSTTTSTPTSLKAGEIAYSYQSNNFFIGTPDGTSVLALGGFNTYTTVNNATNANTASTIVKRDVNGSFSGNLVGSATSLFNAQNFSVSGGDITASAQSFNGTQAVTLSASLNTVSGLTAGTYGTATLIPIITVAANGRIMSIANSSSSISATSSFTVAGNTGSSVFYTGNTFSMKGATGSGITTTETAVGNDILVSFATDNTFARTNTATVGLQTISTDLTIAGNLIVTGTQTFVNTSTVTTNDSLIKLAANNIVGDVVDIGFYGSSNTGSSVQYHGLIREGSGGTNAGNFYLFKNLATDPTGNTVSYAGLSRGDLYAGNLNVTSTLAANGSVSTGIYTGSYTDGIILDYDAVAGNARISAGAGKSITFYNNANSTRNALLAINQYGNITTGGWQANTIGIAYGGTNNTSFTAGQITYYDGSKIASLANTGTAGTYANAAYVPVITTDGWGRISSVTNTAIAIDASQITSGSLSVSRGGTGATSFSSGSIVIGSGTGALTTLANSSYSLTGSLGTNNTLTSLTVDAYGRVTAATGAAISGLTVSQGGTGTTTFTTNGIVYGNAGSALGVTSAAGTSDATGSYQILTTNATGVPVWTTTMDGGSF
jgi:hypothetical protein